MRSRDTLCTIEQDVQHVAAAVNMVLTNKTTPINRNTEAATVWDTNNLPVKLYVANLLPGHIADAPDFLTADDAMETKAEAARFERFLDEHFPREKFAKFRSCIDKPIYPPGPYIDSNLVVPFLKPSKPSRLWTYRMAVEIRREMRAAARINKLIALSTGKPQPPLRICEACKLVFVARRKDAQCCSEKCSSLRRVRRARANAKLYEQNRKLKGARG